MMVVTALLVALLTGVGFGLSGAGAREAIWWAILLGSMTGLLVFLISSVRDGWPAYALTAFAFAVGRRLPFRLMPFLEDAYHRGVLRKVGAVYQFRHLRLQQHLAERS